MAGPERTEAQVRSQTEHQGPCHAGSCIASRWILHNIQELSRTVIFTFALALKKKNLSADRAVLAVGHRNSVEALLDVTVAGYCGPTRRFLEVPVGSETVSYFSADVASFGLTIT